MKIWRFRDIDELANLLPLFMLTKSDSLLLRARSLKMQ
jgi:hypothetical protein